MEFFHVPIPQMGSGSTNQQVNLSLQVLDIMLLTKAQITVSEINKTHRP